jgi:acyl dehydratase
VTRVRSYDARFAGVAYPGETLRVRMRRERAGAAAPPGADVPVRVEVTAVERGDAPVLTETVVGCG